MKFLSSPLFKIVVTLFFVSIFAYFMAFNKSASTDNNVLVVGTASGYAPFVSLNSQGEYEGFDIDVATELARRMNKKLVLTDCGSMVPLMLSLQQGSVDLLIWALEINKARLDKMAMIQYQGGNVTTYPFIFWQSIPDTVKSIEDLKNVANATVCIEPGSSQERFLNKYEFITKKPLEKVVDMIMDLKYGKSLAAMVDPSLLKNLRAKNPELKVLDVPLDENSMSFGNGICVKKENKALIEQVSKVIETMKADGTIARLETKWNLD
jgi:ABC-type amino acid transport substrate-binding protein